MNVYQSQIRKLPGTNYGEIHTSAKRVFKEISSTTRRNPYVRSVYFKKEKVFLNHFWSHMMSKNWRDRSRRIKYCAAAIDLIRNSRFQPVSKENPNERSEVLHRFAGRTKEGESFFVQIKENKRSGEKYLISVFPCQ
jgi:hypothetical protein